MGWSVGGFCRGLSPVGRGGMGFALGIPPLAGFSFFEFLFFVVSPILGSPGANPPHISPGLAPQGFGRKHVYLSFKGLAP